MQDDLRRAFKQQGDGCRKRVARAFIHELRVDDERRAIKPVYRLRDCLPDDADEFESEGDSLTACVIWDFRWPGFTNFAPLLRGRADPAAGKARSAGEGWAWQVR